MSLSLLLLLLFYLFIFLKRLQIIKSLIFRVLGIKNPIFNKIWPPLSFWRATFEFFIILKYFKINMNLNSVIPSDGIYGINSCKNNGLWWGPYICDFMIDLLISWLAFPTWLICSVLDMRLIISVHNSLTLFHVSALLFASQVRIRSYSGYFLYIFWFSYVHDWFEYLLISSSLPHQLHSISRDPTLGT